MIRRAAAAGLAVLAVPAAAQPENPFWSPPAASVAWVAVDGAVFRTADKTDPLGTLLVAGVDAAAFSLVPWPPESLGGPRAILRALTDGPWPWRLSLMEIETDVVPRQPAERSVRPTRILAAIEVQAPAAEHPALLNGVRAALGLGPGTALDPVELPPAPGGQPAVWSPVACRRVGEVFVVGFGEGAIERWSNADQGDAAWAAHAKAMTGHRGRPVVAAFADLNALRRAMPDAFGNTPLRRTLRAVGLGNARDAMIRVRLVEPADVPMAGGAGTYAGPPLLAIDAAWSSRLEAPGTIRTTALAGAEWPAGIAGLEPRPPAGAAGGTRYAVAARADWVRWASVVLNVWLGSGVDQDEVARTAKLTRWQRTHGDTLGRVIRAAGGWAVAWAPAEQPALFMAAPCASDARALADQRIIFGSIHDAVAFDARARAWSVGFDAAALRLRWTVAPGGSGGVLAELRNP